jgi:2-polyprenyl-3-methyl-5-hydroxy-6-metoxy-1,4-benzoquinol methylase
METVPAPLCPVCGAAGSVRYRDLPDRLFGTTGIWSFKSCTRECGVLWLDPIPRDLRKSYEFYHTHLGPRPPERRSAGQFLRAIYKPIKNGYLRARLGYCEGAGPSWWRLFAPLAFLHPAGVAAIAGDAMFLRAPSPGGRLLEIGSGNGVMLEKMRSRGWDVTGIEFDPACVAQTATRGLTCYGRDLRELALPSDSFDAIYMGHVIEHLYDPRSLLIECHRILKPGGELVIVTPNAGGWGHQHYQQDWRGLEAPRHLQLFSPESLRRLMKETGFPNCRVRTTNRSAWYALGMSAAMRSARRQNASHDAALLSMISGRALAFQIFGRLLCLFRPGSGEEIVLSGRGSASAQP